MDFFSRRRVEKRHDQSTTGRSRSGDLRNTPLRNARKPRHSGLFAAVSRLDTEIDPAARAELARWVREQYETEYGDIPLGFMARCYLGPPYVDHRLDLLHDIVEHFAPADAVPEPFARARMLVRNDAYAFVEVYASGEIRPVFADGTVVSDGGGSAPL